MVLSSTQLEAFAEVAKVRSFSKAAQALHITQSALSQRILNLEDELKTALIVRDPAGLRLTPSGEQLLRYCHIKSGLEREVLENLSTGNKELGGIIRIAGFSSVMRSIVMPSLAEFIALHPRVQVELFTKELSDLSSMLTNGEADMIISADEPFRNEILSHFLGFEEYVLVEVAGEKIRNGIYLDHDARDPTTFSFFKLNSVKLEQLNRNYLDEIYAVLDGVRLGWGRAVLPKHLLEGHPELRIVKGYKALKSPVMIQHFKQPYYSRLHECVMELLCKKAPAFLSRGK